MSEIFPVILAACLVNNLVLENLLGVSAVHAVSRTLETAQGMALAMLIILPVTTTGCFLAHQYLLVPAHLDYLRLPVFVVLLILCMAFIRFTLARFRPEIIDRIEVYFPLMLVNSSLLGTALLAIEHSAGLLQTLMFSTGSALGFGIILIIFSAMRTKLAEADVPAPFKGTAVLLITLALLAMAFSGLAGLKL